MHTLIFSRLDLDLNCCSTSNDLIQMIMKVYLNKNRRENQKYTFVILLDHILDRKLGYDVLTEVSEIQYKFSLNIIWVLLSSTEDRNTLKFYEDKGVEHIIEKPLTSGKLKNLLKDLNAYNV